MFEGVLKRITPAAGRSRWKHRGTVFKRERHPEVRGTQEALCLGARHPAVGITKEALCLGGAHPEVGTANASFGGASTRGFCGIRCCCCGTVIAQHHPLHTSPKQQQLVRSHRAHHADSNSCWRPHAHIIETAIAGEDHPGFRTRRCCRGAVVLQHHPVRTSSSL